MVSFKAIPEAGYEVESWWINGAPAQPGGLAFTTTLNQSEHTIHVTFRSLPGPP